MTQFGRQLRQRFPQYRIPGAILTREYAPEIMNAEDPCHSRKRLCYDLGCVVDVMPILSQKPTQIVLIHHRQLCGLMLPPRQQNPL